VRAALLRLLCARGVCEAVGTDCLATRRWMRRRTTHIAQARTTPLRLKCLPRAC